MTRSTGEDALTTTLARQIAVIDDLATRADNPLAWLALRRQAVSYLRHVEPMLGDRFYREQTTELEGHAATLTRHRLRADEALKDVDPPHLDRARAGLGLRLALIGKGGTGKTVIASTLARMLARKGRRVFAADLDSNPGLALSIGMGNVDLGFPAALVEEHEGAAYGWRLTGQLTPLEAVERFATVGPDGVRILTLGKIAGCDKTGPKRSVVALVQLLLGFGEPGWDVIADLEAGPTTPFERYHAFADDVMVVVGPAWRSALTARRLLPMVGDRNPLIVGNRFAGEPAHAGLAPLITVPFDPAVAEAERQGLSPLDACGDSPAIEAIRRLAHLLTATQQEART